MKQTQNKQTNKKSKEKKEEEKGTRKTEVRYKCLTPSQPVRSLSQGERKAERTDIINDIKQTTRTTTNKSINKIAPMGSPSHGGGVSRLSLPTPFSPIFVCPSAYWNLSSVLLFTHQLLPTYLQFSSSDCPSCLHRPFAYISLLYKPSFATSLFLCGPLETRHVDRVPLPSYRLNSPTPTADQVEEENLQLPTVVKAEEGNTLLQVKAVGQMVLASPERQTVYAMETQNTNPGRMDPPAR